LFFEVYSNLILSEFDLSSLGVKEIESDSRNLTNLTITSSKSREIPKGIQIDNQTRIDKDYGYYFKKDTGLFEFLNGQEIKVSSYNNKLDQDFLRILLNFPFACIFSQKGYLALHASAVKYLNRTFLFPGSSLTGKSSIAALLVQKGGKLITEDTAIISIKDSMPKILPSYPMIKISDDINKELSLSKIEGIKFFKEINERKGYLLSNQQMISKPEKIDYCIFPEWSKGFSKLIPMSKGEGIRRILNSSLSILPFYDKDEEKEHFKEITSFVRNIDVLIYARKKSISNLKGLTKLLDKI